MLVNLTNILIRGTSTNILVKLTNPSWLSFQPITLFTQITNVYNSIGQFNQNIC